jgi:hypothetical protein
MSSIQSIIDDVSEKYSEYLEMIDDDLEREKAVQCWLAYRVAQLQDELSKYKEMYKYERTRNNAIKH